MEVSVEFGAVYTGHNGTDSGVLFRHVALRNESHMTDTTHAEHIFAQSCKTTLSSELLIWTPALRFPL
jgi:hypothetical protein